MTDRIKRLCTFAIVAAVIAGATLAAMELVNCGLDRLHAREGGGE